MDGNHAFSAARLSRFVYLATSILFLFFLIYSIPHRVHHLFDDTNQEPCVAYLLTKSCHIQGTNTFSFGPTQIIFHKLAHPNENWLPYLIFSLHPPRAPPAV